MLMNGWRLCMLVWKARKKMVIGVLLVFTALSAVPFLQSGVRALLVNNLIAATQGGGINTNLWWLLAALIATTALPPILFTVQSYLSRLFWFFLDEHIQLIAVIKKGELDMGTHEDPKLQNLFTTIAEQGTWRCQAFIDRQFYLFQNVVEVIIASVVIISFGFPVFLLILVGTIPELIVEARFGVRVWSIDSSRAETRRRYWTTKSYFEQLPSLVELRLFQNNKYFIGVIRDLFKNFWTEEKGQEKRKMWYRVAVLCISQAIIGFVLVSFVLDVVHGALLIGTLTFVLASIAELRQSLSSLFSNIGRQYSDSLYVTDLFKFLDLQPLLSRPQNPVKLSHNTTPEIIFENVTFSYPGSPTPVLKNFSLTIAPGEKVAIIGINGAGKTTLVKLLCRFYDPTEGRILLDGIDLKDLDPETWYAALGAIFQDFVRYQMGVKEAISIGRTNVKATAHKIHEAARAAEADDFISAWADKYNQMLGKQYTNGIEPSIGQWQKLALARTFFRDPRVYILDEPTSSIDAEAEANIFAKLETLPEDRTVILISHRFSTVRQANKIAVIEHGNLAELGTHEELLKLNGTYARLFRLQAKGYE